MGRAYGSNASLLLKRESSYGTKATGNYRKMPFTGSSLGSEQGLIDSPVLGFGRDPEAPYLDVNRVEGDIGIPVDHRYLGKWLTGLFGDPVSTQVAATGTITFSANPSNTQTITLNGVTWTFVTGSPTGNQTQIAGSLAATLAQLVTDLNGSANTSIDDATYTENDTALIITHDTIGTAGNAYTLAASHGTVSASTLEGGGYEHVFESGSDDLPSYTAERGHPEVPAFLVHTGVMLNSIAFNFQRSGPATATVNAIAQGEAIENSTQGGTPTELDFDRVSQFKGALKRDGVLIGNVTGANFTYSNNLERIETIRDDEKIDGTDPTQASASGSLDVRFADLTFLNLAKTNTPTDIEFSYKLSAGLQLSMVVHEGWLSKPKQEVSGPGGVQSSFDFRGARDSTAGCMVTVTLLNDLDGTQYT
jgi:hypothetical protein